MPPDDARVRVLAAVRRWGSHATSFPMLERGLSYWFDETGAVVAYVASGTVRVVAGPPVAPAGDLGRVAMRFADDAKKADATAAFFWVDDAFVAAIRRARGDAAVVAIGAQPEWSPATWTLEGAPRATLRAQIRRASRKGVVVRRVPAECMERDDAPERRALSSVLARWLGTRSMSPMRFLVDVQPYDHARERRYYLAERDGRAVAALVAVPVFARRGWFFEDVLRTPEAPNGAVEQLVDAAMRDVGADGAEYATLGLAPLARVPTGDGPHRTLRRVLAFCYRRLGVLYPFATLAAFKQRFVPDAWAVQYLVVLPGRSPAVALAHVLRVFTGGRMTWFAIATAWRMATSTRARRAATAVAAITTLLVPWTIALACADGMFWFHSVRVQRAWVTFDAAMVVALSALLALLALRRAKAARVVAALLASAAAVDFALTTSEAIAMHAHDDIAKRAIASVAVTGPLLATIVLGRLAALATTRSA